MTIAEIKKDFNVYDVVKTWKSENEQLHMEKARLQAKKAQLEMEKARLDAEHEQLEAESARVKAK